MATETVSNIAQGYVPYDDAHLANGLMLQCLTLIHAIMDMNQDEGKNDYHGISSTTSRTDCLAMQAIDKLVEAMSKLGI